MTASEPAAAVAMDATGGTVAATESTPPPPPATATESPTTTSSASADDGATPLPPLLPSQGAVDTAAATSPPALRSAIAATRTGIESATEFVAAHTSMPAAALARVDARVDGALASFTRALRRTRDGTTSGMVAAGGVLGGGALVAAPLAYGMCSR